MLVVVFNFSMPCHLVLLPFSRALPRKFLDIDFSCSSICKQLYKTTSPLYHPDFNTDCPSYNQTLHFDFLHYIEPIASIAGITMITDLVSQFIKTITSQVRKYTYPNKLLSGILPGPRWCAENQLQLLYVWVCQFDNV